MIGNGRDCQYSARRKSERVGPLPPLWIGSSLRSNVSEQPVERRWLLPTGFFGVCQAWRVVREHRLTECGARWMIWGCESPTDPDGGNR
jgi:hypothetical protein